MEFSAKIPGDMSDLKDVSRIEQRTLALSIWGVVGVAAGSIALAAGIGFLSAAIPALNVTRRDIALALRATV